MKRSFFLMLLMAFLYCFSATASKPILEIKSFQRQDILGQIDFLGNADNVAFRDNILIFLINFVGVLAIQYEDGNKRKPKEVCNMYNAYSSFEKK